MRNINGAPATGPDFYGRESVLLRLIRILLTDSLLFTAPRRVGKSSVILRLRDLLQLRVTDTSFQRLLKTHGLLDPIRELQPVPVYFTAEDCSSELDFAQKLASALQQQGNFKADSVQEIASWVRELASQAGIRRLPLQGIDQPFGDAKSNHTIRSLITSLLRNVETQPNSGTAIIAIDELPELLLKLESQEDGPRRVSEFLHWLRALRQEFHKKIRWIFLGSIGLDTFVDQRSLTKTLGGLVPVTLGAWEPDEADGFLKAIGPAVGLELSADVRAAILQHAGWAIPYHLQIIIQALVELKSPRPAHHGLPLTPCDVSDVALAVERLLQPDGFMRFDTWRQRLKDQLSAPDHTAALRILRCLCSVPAGLPRQRLLHELQKTSPEADPDLIAERLSQLLGLLQRDGYLLEQNGLYAFRSFLLREYWYRREVR